MNKIRFILLQARKDISQYFLIRTDKIQLVQKNKGVDMENGSIVFLSGPVSRIDVCETPQEILILIKEK